MRSHRIQHRGRYAIQSHWKGSVVPKQVDHDARRHEIAEAVFRLVARQGLEAVSLRHVAAEAGVSMGRVQHYFATKDEMLRFSFQVISERADQRLGVAMAAAGPEPRSQLRAFLVEMLLLSDEGRAEAPVLAAFLARSVVEPALSAPMREGGRRMTDFVAGLILAGQRDDLDANREAGMLLALADGLMLHVLTGQVDAGTALATLDYQLDRIFSGARRRR